MLFFFLFFLYVYKCIFDEQNFSYSRSRFKCDACGDKFFCHGQVRDCFAQYHNIGQTIFLDNSQAGKQTPGATQPATSKTVPAATPVKNRVRTLTRRLLSSSAVRRCRRFMKSKIRTNQVCYKAKS